MTREKQKKKEKETVVDIKTMTMHKINAKWISEKSQRIFDEENNEKISSNLSRRQSCLRCVHRVGDSAFYSQSTFLSTACWADNQRADNADHFELKEQCSKRQRERYRAREREQVRACSEVLQRADKARQSGRGIKEATAHTHTLSVFVAQMTNS